MEAQHALDQIVAQGQLLLQREHANNVLTTPNQCREEAPVVDIVDSITVLVNKDLTFQVAVLHVVKTKECRVTEELAR